MSYLDAPDFIAAWRPRAGQCTRERAGRLRACCQTKVHIAGCRGVEALVYHSWRCCDDRA